MLAKIIVIAMVSVPACAQHVIEGEIELDVTQSVAGEHKDEHVIEGVEKGFASFLGVATSYVHMNFSHSAVDHSGHDHSRRLPSTHEVGDYTVTFPATSTGATQAESARVMLMNTKTNTTKQAALKKAIVDAVTDSKAEAAAAGETISTVITGVEVLKVPAAVTDKSATSAPAAPASATPSNSQVSFLLGLMVVLVAPMC